VLRQYGWMARKIVIVSGRVQGVGFRWATLEEAERLGLSGSVRNENDGTVRVEIEGDDLAPMLAWLGRGPRYAEVTALDVTDAPETGIAGFRVG